MTDKAKRLSDTTRTLLTAAAMRDDYLILPPQLPIAAARQVVHSLLGSGLAEEVPASGEAADFAWRKGDGGRAGSYRGRRRHHGRVSRERDDG
jgi:hypothetical protein